MDLTRMFRTKAAKMPIPGADAARDAVTTLYRTCGFPDPAVVVAPDRRTFEARYAKMTESKTSAELLDEFTCSTLILAFTVFAFIATGLFRLLVESNGSSPLIILSVISMVFGMHAIPDAFDTRQEGDTLSLLQRFSPVCVIVFLPLSAFMLITALPVPISDFHLMSDNSGHAWATLAAYSVFGVVCVMAWFWVWYPVGQSLTYILRPNSRRVRNLPALTDALQSSECLAPEFEADQDSPLHWEPDDRSAVPRIGSRVGTAAVVARSLVDAAVLGDGFVLVLPAGLGNAPDPVAEAKLRAAENQVFLARVRKLSSLEPARAQAEMGELGVARVVQALNLKPLSADGYGTLWQVDVSRGRLRWLQSLDPATGNDVWLAVPGHVTSPHEAVAWSYGVSADDYEPTLQG